MKASVADHSVTGRYNKVPRLITGGDEAGESPGTTESGTAGGSDASGLGSTSPVAVTEALVG